MEAESFFARWAQRNAEAAAKRKAVEAAQPAQPISPPEETPEIPPPPPTLEDVAQLTHDSDFKPFVARGVDESVRRSAMKKLFTDPHFNVMDGLDVYIEDYNKYEPIPASMLAALNHAQTLLDPLARIENPLMRLIDAIEEKNTHPQPPHQPQSNTATDNSQKDEQGEGPPAQEPPTHDDDPV